MRSRALTFTLAALALLPAPAGAATVDLVADASTPPLLRIVAAPGETNVVNVAADTPTGHFVVTDPGAPLTVGPGCTGSAGGPVICAADLSEAEVQLDLGDGHDRASAPLPASVALIADGGAGDDEISGGEGDDVLRGGSGDDVLDGDVGRDVADYRERTARVVVDVSTPGFVGEVGERDSLTGIETAWGGAGDDAIRSAGGARCGRGRDRLTPVGSAATRVAGDCELVVFARGVALERTIRLRGRSLRLVVTGGGAVRVGARVGRTTVARRVRLDRGRRRRVTLRLPARAAATVRRSGRVRIAAAGRTLTLRVRR